jgi:hypothetical protein
MPAKNLKEGKYCGWVTAARSLFIYWVITVDEVKWYIEKSPERHGQRA